MEADLLKEAKYFDSLVELVPVAHYLPADEEAESNTWRRVNMSKNQKRPLDPLKKQKSRVAKRQKFDPSLHMSTVEAIKKKKSEKEPKERVETIKSDINFARMKFDKNPMVPQKSKKKESLNKLLKKAVEKKKVIESAPETVQNKILWNDALEKAKGEKIRDDPELLRKAQKRKNIMKKKSKQKWDSRAETERNIVKEQQDKRQANIDLRRETKEGSRRSKLEKKRNRKARAGFEGRRISSVSK